MSKTIFKVFMAWEFEEEEQWLNRMADEGWLLTKSNGFFHHFEQGTAGAYQYRVQMMNFKKDPQYLNFLSEVGIEHVGTCANNKWIYLRKENDGQPFELFSDSASRVKHLQSIRNLLNLCTALLVFCLLLEAALAVDMGSFLPLLVVLMALGVLIPVSRGIGSINAKIAALEKEQSIYEH